jgi:hypothetical protein
MFAKDLWILQLARIGPNWPQRFPIGPNRSQWFPIGPNWPVSFRFVPKVFLATASLRSATTRVGGSKAGGYAERYGLFLSFVRVVHGLN